MIIESILKNLPNKLVTEGKKLIPSIRELEEVI
jgi:hypothetical protein